jgi:DNA-binding XRE family transcriptional regulator
MADFLPFPTLVALRYHQLKDARRLAHITGDDMARRVGVSRQSIVKIEGSEQAFEKAAFGTIKKIVAELVRAGIEFLPDGGVVRRGAPAEPPHPAAED